MDRKKIELQVYSLSASHEQNGAYNLLFTEVGGRRQLPVIIGASEAQAIALELRGIHPSRPLTHALFASVLDALGVRLLRVLIYKAEKGIFYTYIYLRSGEILLRIDSRTSDAVALALHMGAPVLIYDDLLQRECIPPMDEEPEELSEEELLKQNEEALKAALQKAIDEENYEQAAVLRDRLRQLHIP